MVNIEKIRVTDQASINQVRGSNADLILIIDAPLPFNTATIFMPESPNDGQLFLISCNVSISGLTLDSSGKTVVGGINTLVTIGVVGWVFHAVNNSWYPYSNTVVGTKSQVGLSNVDNTSDTGKPISTAQQTALNLKAPLANPTFTGAVGGVTAAMVGLGSVNNTADSAKPVSTAQQTALDGKQATLVSGTNIKTINGASILGSGDLIVSGGLGYTLSVQALTSSPADGATIFFGQLPKAPVTVAATSKIFIRKAGTIKIAQIYCFSGTAGTAEAWPMSIRLNNTTDTLIASLSVSTSERVFSNTGLNIAVVAGDFFEIKLVNPTWVTNPLTCIFGGYVYIE